MKRSACSGLILSAALLCCGPSWAEATTDQCGITSEVRADGTVLLGNTGSTARCDVAAGKAGAAPPVALPPVEPSRPATGVDKPEPPALDSSSSGSDGAKDPRELYKDAMLRAAPGTTAANPAVSRRYKMMDKQTYQATVLGNDVSGPSGGSDAGQTPSR